MKTRLFIFAALLILLASCAPATTSAPSAPPMPTATLTPAPPTREPPTPLPTQPHLPILTPDAIQVAHWKDYQRVLASCVFSYGNCSDSIHATDSGALCEWDILGRSGKEVYIWAICSRSDIADSRKPLVIYLDTDESIQEIKFGGYKGPNYNLELFPTDIQEKILLFSADPTYISMVKEFGKHLTWRLTHSEEPPLIVLSTTQ